MKTEASLFLKNNYLLLFGEIKGNLSNFMLCLDYFILIFVFSISISESRFKVWKRTALAPCIPSFDVCKIMGHEKQRLYLDPKNSFILQVSASFWFKYRDRRLGCFDFYVSVWNGSKRSRNLRSAFTQQSEVKLKQIHHPSER